MAQKFTQKLSAQKPIDFNFSNAFVSGDNVISVTVTVPVGDEIEEVAGHRAISGQIVQCRFDTTGATIGKEYAISVKATTTGGDVEVLDLDLTVEAD